MILSLPRNLWLLVYLWIIYDEVSMFMIDLFYMKKKLHIEYVRKNCTEYQVFELYWFLDSYILVDYVFIYNKSTSIRQLKYKHRFMSAIYFDWIPICFIKCKNISFGKQNSCCSSNIASFNIAILIWCEERGKRFKSYANYLFYNFCDL